MRGSASLSNWNTRPSRLCLTRAGFADNAGSAVRAPDLSFLAPLEASMVLPLRYLRIDVSCILIRDNGGGRLLRGWHGLQPGGRAGSAGKLSADECWLTQV